MNNDEAIVLRECTAIMADMPAELKHDDEILDAVLNSLTQGQSAMKVRQDALEIAQMKLEAKVDSGFELVSHEFQKVRHDAELDRVHASYAKQEALQAKAIAEAAMLRTHEIATTAAVASAKADGAKDIAKQSRNFMFDPLTGITITVAIFVLMWIFTSVKVEQKPIKEEPTGSIIKCGVDVNCTYNNAPAPANNNSRSYIRPRGGV